MENPGLMEDNSVKGRGGRNGGAWVFFPISKVDHEIGNSSSKSMESVNKCCQPK
jgi:hypothetical protein